MEYTFSGRCAKNPKLGMELKGALKPDCGPVIELQIKIAFLELPSDIGKIPAPDSAPHLGNYFSTLLRFDQIAIKRTAFLPAG